MRRRIAMAVVVAVVAALALAGVGTLALSRAAARASTADELRRQSAALAEVLTVATRANLEDPSDAQAVLSRGTLRRLAGALDGRDVAVVLTTPRGRDLGTFPTGVRLTAADRKTLAGGGTVSGSDGRRLLWAVSGQPLRRSTVAVAVTAGPPPLLGGAAGWFALSSLIVVAVAAAAALRLGGRLARPVHDATDVAERIAAGDLTARLPDPPAGDRDEPAVLARSLNAMAASLERSRGLERQFLLSVSHDLRTPLTNIRGYAEAVEDGAAGPADGARVIQTEAARLQRLVDDLLDLARLEARTFSLHPVAADLTQVVTGAAESFRAELEGAGLVLDVRGSAPAPGAVDVDRLAQVVGNLLANARRFARSAVVVTADPEPGGLLVQVTNDGPAIAAEDLPHVFERLYRAKEQPERSESGSGLGLAIVRDLVGAMGGEVGVRSPATGGTTFWFRVPAAPPPPVPPTHGSTTPAT